MALRVFGGCRAYLMQATKSSSGSAAIAGGKAQKGIMKPVPISPELGKFLGANQVSRSEAIKQIWQYIKLHNLQNPENKKKIRCDEKLKTIFNGKDTVGFLEVAGLLSQHFVKSA